MSNSSQATLAADRKGPPIKPVSHGRAVLFLALGTAFLAGTPLWVKATNMDPATQAFLRVVIGCVILIPFGISEMRKKEKLGKQGIILSVIAGLFLGIDFTAWNFSIFYVGAGIAAILLNLQVIIVPMLTAVFDKYKIPPVFLILVPIMTVGVLLTGGVFEPAEASGGPETIYGMKTATLGTIFGLTSGVCYSFYLYLSRKAGTSARKDLYIQPMMYTMAAQAIPPTLIAFFTPFGRGGFDFTNGVFVDGQLPLVNPETAVGDPLTAWNWFNLICLATLGQALAWTFVQYGTVWLDPTLSAGILLLSPVTSVIIAAPLFGEIPSVLQVVGIFLILGTVAYQNGMFSMFSKKKKPDPVNPDTNIEDQLIREGLAPGHSPDEASENPNKH